MAAKYSDTLTTRDGSVLVGATVSLANALGGLQTLYSNVNLSTPLLNPTQAVTDTNGYVEFYVADGVYSITEAYGSVSETHANVQIFDLQGLDNRVVSGRAAVDLTNVNWPSISVTVLGAMGTAMQTAGAINAYLARNGSLPATADIPMGGFKITGLGAATAAGHALTFDQASASAGARLIGADDGASGAAFTTLQGFVSAQWGKPTTVVQTGWAPAQHSGIIGSVGGGPISLQSTRTGGYGTYGANLTQLLVSAATRATEFDVGITSWVNHQNLQNYGQVFGGWIGANSPSNSLGQMWTTGATIGLEVNAGNRWADFGFQVDVAGARYTVGIQSVPDIVPAPDGTTAAVYPGTFSIIVSQSVHGHKWWTGYLSRYDAIMPGGVVASFNGGSVSGNAALLGVGLGGYFTNGIDLSAASFSNACLKVGFGAVSGTATAGVAAVLPSNPKGYVIIDVGGTLQKLPYYNV